MSARLVLVVLMLATLGCTATSVRLADESGDGGRAGVAQRQILVTLKQSESAAIGLLGAPGRRYIRRRDYGPSPAVDRALDQLAAEHDLRRVRGWPIDSLEVYCEVLAVPEAATVEDVLARLGADPRVDLAQAMNVFQTLALSYDDPYLELQSAVAQLDVAQAHTLATGKDVLIAVIDSAVDLSHPDLRGRVAVMRNLVDSARAPRRGELHGTAVAGVIASIANNTEGIIGIAPDVSIAALRACWPESANSRAALCSTFSLAQALETALRLEPEVINLSLAGPFDPLLSRLLDEAIGRGIVIVAAEPDAEVTRGFPTVHEQVIAAQSTVGRSAESSRYLLAAPASEILTTTPGAGYGFLSGNSMAAAHVSGVIALLMERRPDLGVAEIAALLAETTLTAPGAQSINACRALQRLLGLEICESASAALRLD